MNSRSRTAIARAVAPSSGGTDLGIVIDFYREEFLKHQECLLRQREYFSEHAITSVEAALSRILSQLDRLSAKEDADRVLGRLLRSFDVVTGLSGWTDPKNLH
jgi:hypothetical protein